jgi:hypothetical protein
VNRSFFLCLAACRMRSSACDTLSRCCARRVLCWPTFPLVPALGSTGSAAGGPALFVGFTATMAESDFPCPCVIGDGSSPSRCGPAHPLETGQTRDLPVPAQRASAHARVFDHAGLSGHSRSRARPCRLPSSQRRRHPGKNLFEAQWLAYALPYRRFVPALTGDNARLGADVDR